MKTVKQNSTKIQCKIQYKTFAKSIFELTNETIEAHTNPYTYIHEIQIQTLHNTQKRCVSVLFF